MRIVNHTGFEALVFKSSNPNGHIDWTVIVKGSFRLADGRAVKTKSQPIRYADMYHSGPRSSLAFAADIVAHKPRAEVHVSGSCRARIGSEARAWMVAVSIGQLSAAVRVTGPRAWVRRGDDYELSRPETCESVELRYELAYGGACDHCHDFEPRNPVGRGLYCEDIEHQDMISAPQIELPGEPIDKIGVTYTPAGLSPVAPSWLPRRGFAGTYDEDWKAKRWPRLPDDFDERFGNSAPFSLQQASPFRGDEEVRLVGVFPEGDAVCELSGVTAILSMALSDGIYWVAPRLDTISLDLDARTIDQVWRIRVPEERELRYVGIREARMKG